MEIIQIAILILAIIIIISAILTWFCAKATEKENQGCHKR